MSRGRESLSAGERWAAETEPIHLWFSLSYANYLVAPRSVLQSMPQEWQARFVMLLAEMQDSFGHLDWPTYHVEALAREPELLHEETCPDCEGEGVITPLPTEDERPCPTCDGEGSIDIDPRYETAEEVGFILDPIPHYNRGRTHLEPKS
jgi:hypothetical protein